MPPPSPQTRESQNGPEGEFFRKVLMELSLPFLPRLAHAYRGRDCLLAILQVWGRRVPRPPQAGASPSERSAQAPPPLPAPKGLGQSGLSTWPWQVDQTVPGRQELTTHQFSQCRPDPCAQAARSPAAGLPSSMTTAPRSRTIRTSRPFGKGEGRSTARATSNAPITSARRFGAAA